MIAPLPDLVRIPPGPFQMGADDGGDDERPAHAVMLEAFEIGAAPVTQAEYAVFVRATGRRPPGVHALPAIVREAAAETFRQTAAPYAWTGATPPPGLEHHPVVLVTIDDAQAYCAWLSGATGRAFRLPTEAEWEKAARGGTDGRRYPWGDDIDLSMANFAPHAQQRTGRGTTPARTYPANAYGLFDMAGNVWNWVSDWYAPRYDGVADGRRLEASSAGALRVVRGGGWVNADVSYLRCACRHPVPPDTYSYSIGFRVASGDRV